MEKDRALNLLQNGLLPQVHGAYYDALKMAIDGWQPEPCEDAISRDAVCEILSLVYSEYYGASVLTYANLVMDRVEQMPSVMPQEPCGKDINVTTTDAISRQAVLDKAKYWIAMQETKTGFIEKRGDFVDSDDIKALPSVTPQKIIRCKDCKHFKGKVVCEWHAGFYPDAEYFCADAEEKEEGE